MARLHPFRFGVSVRRAASAAEWRAKARRAEELGYDILLVPDHLSDNFPPLTALTAAADATSRLRVGTYVLNNDFHHPVFLASEVATIDLLTGGRFELGIGAGHMEAEYAAAGLPFDSGGMRVARLAESVAILKRLLAGATVSHAGQHYTVREHRTYPAPTQQPVPLLVGGNGRRVLELGAREASAISFTGFFPAEGGRVSRLSHFTAEGLAQRIDIVRAAAGQRIAELEFNVLVQGVTIARSADAALNEVAPNVPGLTEKQIRESPFLLLGSHKEIAQTLIERRERFGVSYICVFEPAMEALGPVVARLSGS